MTNNRGTRFVNVPIRFSASATHADWNMSREDGNTVFEGWVPTMVSLKSVRISDGWELLRQFLKVDTRDDDAILNFLVAHGQFKSPIPPPTKPTIATGPIIASPSQPLLERNRCTILERIPKRAFANLQEYLRRSLLMGNPTLPNSWEQFQQYSILFARTRTGSEAVVVVSGVFPSMLATVQFKLAQGATFKACARKDCRLPFEITSRHRRKFCTQYCAHITSLRSRRKTTRNAAKIDQQAKSAPLKGR